MPKIEISDGIKNLLDAHLEAFRMVNSDDDEGGWGVTLYDPINKIVYMAFSDGDKGAIYLNELTAIETHIGDLCLLCKIGNLIEVFDCERVPALHLECAKCYAAFVIAEGELCLTD